MKERDELLRLEEKEDPLQHSGIRDHSLDVTTVTETVPTDEALVQRARRGDRAAFEALVERYARVVHVVAQRLSGPGVDASDLLQEAFLRAWSGLGRLEQPGRFGAWLLAILRTTAQELRRAGQRNRGAALDPETDADPGQAPSAGPENRERDRAVLDAIERLPDEVRLVVTLRLVDGLDSRQIAERLGRPHGTIRSLLCRARRRLRDELEEWHP